MGRPFAKVLLRPVEHRCLAMERARPGRAHRADAPGHTATGDKPVPATALVGRAADAGRRRPCDHELDRPRRRGPGKRARRWTDGTTYPSIDCLSMFD